MWMAWRDGDQLGDTAAVQAGGLRASCNSDVSFAGKVRGGRQAGQDLSRGLYKSLQLCPRATPTPISSAPPCSTNPEISAPQLSFFSSAHLSSALDSPACCSPTTQEEVVQAGRSDGRESLGQRGRLLPPPL